MDKLSIFKDEINYVKDSKLKEDFKTLINCFQIIFLKYQHHLRVNIILSLRLVVVVWLDILRLLLGLLMSFLNNNTVGIKFSSHDKDLIIMALTLHDGLKHGISHEKYVRFDHPLVVSKYIMKIKISYPWMLMILERYVL